MGDVALDYDSFLVVDLTERLSLLVSVTHEVFDNLRSLNSAIRLASASFADVERVDTRKLFNATNFHFFN